ncbi:CgeB family protein [Desulfovibrio aminophilus]|uniref:CgeB family protein n=1 Tax=Desulfovibrio aminophilus TaxID=81425 RepID=UPI0003FC6952|nr:glycosyltransferase [Desulfovibrio aminophilus]
MDKHLRVLVVLPMYGGSLPVGRFCARALRRLGHTVEVLESPDFHSAYKALEGLRVTSDRLQYLENSFLQVVSQAVLAKVETFEPDLVLALAQAPLSIQALKRLRRDKVATAMWFVEDFRLFTYWQAFAPHYDLFAVIQKEPFFEQLQGIGQPNALYLPLAADPEFHRPLELTPAERKEYDADLAFMGAGYPNRRLAFRKLLREGFKIWGTEWEGDPVLKPYVQRNGARVSSEDCVKIFNATAVNLNLHSSIQAEHLVTCGDFINPRTFEIAACGAFQLVDLRGLMSGAFAQDELATFTTMAELPEKIDYFIKNPEEREAFSRRGRARVLAEHTYDRRMDALLDFAAERLPGWPRERSRAAALDAGLPEHLRAEVAALLERLGLPADVSFDDLVWAVRQQQGALSDLDAAVLFLDEWRKLYVERR